MKNRLRNGRKVKRSNIIHLIQEGERRGNSLEIMAESFFIRHKSIYLIDIIF